jgi:heme-degrading monooxygenase HmoA
MFAVINHLHLSKPVNEFQAPIEQEGLLPLLSSLPGFRNFYFVRVSEDRGVVIILWDSAAEAANGANEIGPTWFAQHIAPYLASEQQRSVGEVIVQSERT